MNSPPAEDAAAAAGDGEPSGIHPSLVNRGDAVQRKAWHAMAYGQMLEDGQRPTGDEPSKGAAAADGSIAQPNGPVEESFLVRLRKRIGLLVGLLVFQSFSSFILAAYSDLLTHHPVIIAFLTMLVGAGGNSGNQAAVLVIRGLATGQIGGFARYLWGELKMAVAISLVLVSVGCVRVIAFGYPIESAVAIACSLCSIVFISVVTGAALPMAMDRFGIDPAHAGATIQVIMDLVGVLVTCLICQLILGDPSDHTAPLPVAHPSNALHAAAISSEVQPHQDLSS